MIVPDKKTEAYLNKPISPKRLLQLCQAGVLSSSNFLRAAALCRSDKKWGKFILLILRFLTGLSFLSAIFLMAVSKWHFFYQTGGFIFLVVLFVLCAWIRNQFRVADYAGVGLIGLMIFLPDIVFRTSSFLYQELFLWFALSVVWAVSSRRVGVWGAAFVILNAAIGLYGVQFALPSFIISATLFFVLAAIFNLLCFGVCVFLSDRFFLKKQSCFRFFPLTGMMLFLVAAAGVRCFEDTPFNSGDVAFILCAVCSVFCLYWYVIRVSDRTGRRLAILFSFFWSCLLLYRCLYAFDFSSDFRQALFCTVVSALIGVALISEYLSVVRIKGGKDAV